MSANAFGANPSAAEILNKVTATYKAMKTYKAEGTITTTTGSNLENKEGIGNVSFSILIKKPNIYLVNWSTIAAPPGHDMSYTVWNDGTQPFIYKKHFNEYLKAASDKIMLQGIKRYGGPSSTIPQLFPQAFKEYESLFLWLNNPRIEKIEKIGNEDCYVISGTSEISGNETIWIGKKSYLIKKYYRFRDYKYFIKMHSEYYILNKARLGMTDKQVEDELKNIKLRKPTKSYSEVYTEISFPDLNREDFNFNVPEGAILRDDPF